jgi:hypothetical protein
MWYVKVSQPIIISAQPNLDQYRDPGLQQICGNVEADAAAAPRSEISE